MEDLLKEIADIATNGELEGNEALCEIHRIIEVQWDQAQCERLLEKNG